MSLPSISLSLAFWGWSADWFANLQGKKGEFHMEEHEKPQCHFFMGFLIGGVLGALAGILFAPKSGKELRSDIKEKGSEVIKDGKEIYSDASTRAKEIIEEALHQAKELKKEADRHLSEARQKAKEILAHGEKKEAEAGETEKSRKKIQGKRNSKLGTG
jgi:gas vesicle protein